MNLSSSRSDALSSPVAKSASFVDSARFNQDRKSESPINGTKTAIFSNKISEQTPVSGNTPEAEQKTSCGGENDDRALFHTAMQKNDDREEFEDF